MTDAPHGVAHQHDAATALAAIVLAGGTGERLGGVDKAEVQLAGRRLLDRAVEAARDAGASDIVVVGEVQPTPGVRVVVEDPPRSGPAAGIVAGLAALPETGHVMVLACDLADPAPGARALAAALPLSDDVDGLCVADDGRPQWLFGVYRRRPLDAAASAFGTGSGSTGGSGVSAGAGSTGGSGRSVRALMSSLRLALLPASGEIAVDDIDTWDAHAAWQRRLG